MKLKSNQTFYGVKEYLLTSLYDKLTLNFKSKIIQ